MSVSIVFEYAVCRVVRSFLTVVVVVTPQPLDTERKRNKDVRSMRKRGFLDMLIKSASDRTTAAIV